MKRFIPLFGVLLLMLPMSLAADYDHSLWDALLKRNVIVMRAGSATAVDYVGMQQDRDLLQQYLGELANTSRSTFDAWSVSDQLAFLINLYNASTVELILSEYPGLDSIRDIGFLPGSAWRRDVVSLFGEQVSLDDVEHKTIRGWDRYQEPRIHFAVNCAAKGCPALRAEAYRGDQLDEQLEDNTKLFLADRSRNYVANGRLTVSKYLTGMKKIFSRAGMALIAFLSSWLAIVQSWS